MLRRADGGIGSRWASAAALVALLLASAAPAGARDLVGLTQARFTWSAASGPVAGYRVYVERNYTWPWFPHPTTASVPADARSVVITGNYGEVYRVQVAAIAEDGREGPRSYASEYITFKSPPANPQGNPPPGTPPPAPPGSGSGSGAGSQAPQDPTPDFDGDGIADLLMREETDGSTVVLAMRGEATPRILRLGSVPLASAIAGNGDYDGDGHADLLLRDDNTTAVWMELQADGAVVGGGTLVAALSSDWELAGSGDFNRDGRDDILVRNATSWRLEVWFMNGAQILSRGYLSSPLSSSWQIVGIADFSGDKLADILWYDESTNTGMLSVWGSWLGIQSTAELFRSSSPGDVVAIGDADGNGLPDVVTRHSESGRMRVWFTQLEWSVPKAKTSADLDTAAFTPVDGAPEPLASFEVQGGSDYDGDGRLDLAVRDPAAGDLRVWFLDAATVRGAIGLRDPGPAWFFESVGLENPATHR